MYWTNTCKWSVALALCVASPMQAQVKVEVDPAVSVDPQVVMELKAATEAKLAQTKALASVDVELVMEKARAAMEKTALDPFDVTVAVEKARAAMAYAPGELMLAQVAKGKAEAFSFQFAQQKPGREGARADQAYQRGMRALDDKKWEEAINFFGQVTGEGATRADAAIYWTAYSQNKLGRRNEALASIANLKKQFPQSRWQNEANALEVEVKQAAGRPVSPDSIGDDDVKLMALNGLMNSDPERALTIVEKMITTSQSPKVKERALFILSQSDSPKAREVLIKVARGGANPDLQRLAVRNLGVHGGRNNGQLLAEIYQSQPDPAIRREILRAFMVSGDTSRLAAAAKTEKDPDLRREAIRQLGASNDVKSLSDLLASETDTRIRMEIVQSFMVAGDSARLVDIANTEKDNDVRRRAVQMLGTMGREKTGDALVQIYQKTSDVETKRAVIRAFMTQDNAKSLVDVARKEPDPDLKREAVRQLSHMRSKEATDFMIELLDK